MRWLLVVDTLERGCRLAIGGLVVAGVVRRSLAFALEPLIAIVRGADPIVFRFCFSARKRYDRHLVIVLFCHSRSFRLRTQVPTSSRGGVSGTLLQDAG